MTLNALVWVILLTLTPTLELRASIPYAIVVESWSPLSAALVGIAANIALAPLVWLFVSKAMHIVLSIKWIDDIYQHIAAKSLRRLQPKVEKYGIWGLALFIGVPFPGTGVYSGCLAATLLNFSFKDYMRASVAGCLIAGVAVTLIVASGDTAFAFMVKGLH